MRKPDLKTRIAVTGMCLICSIGRNKEEVWQSIVESRAGIGKLTRFAGETFPTDMAAEVADAARSASHPKLRNSSAKAVRCEPMSSRTPWRNRLSSSAPRAR